MFSKRPAPPEISTFPYTTLFRSSGGPSDAIGRSPSPTAATSDASTSASRSARSRSEEHTSELQSLRHLVCRLLLEKKKFGLPNNLGNPGFPAMVAHRLIPYVGWN